MDVVILVFIASWRILPGETPTWRAALLCQHGGDQQPQATDPASTQGLHREISSVSFPIADFLFMSVI